MKAFAKPSLRQPLYVYVSADTKDFIKQLNEKSVDTSEGKIIDAAIKLLKSSKVK